MRTVLRAAVLLGCVLALAASATAPGRGSPCPYGANVETGKCLPGSSAPAWTGLPPLVRNETVNEVTSVEGATVAARPGGAAGWHIKIANNTDAVMSILLDESSFVTSTGESGGRLISGSTRKMDTAKAQPPKPLVPGATLVEFVVVEKMVDAEEGESDARKNSKTLEDPVFSQEQVNNLGAKLLRITEEGRMQWAGLIRGGKIYVTIQTAAGKQTWIGVVTDGKPQ
jgi:hypothetical protein